MKALSVLDLKPGQKFLFSEEQLRDKGEYEFLCRTEDGMHIRLVQDGSRWFITSMDCYETIVEIPDAEVEGQPLAQSIAEAPVQPVEQIPDHSESPASPLMNPPWAA